MGQLEAAVVAAGCREGIGVVVRLENRYASGPEQPIKRASRGSAAMGRRAVEEEGAAGSDII